MEVGLVLKAEEVGRRRFGCGGIGRARRGRGSGVILKEEIGFEWERKEGGGGRPLSWDDG